MKRNNFSKHIILIVILVIMMFALVFLSSERNTNINYDFNTDVEFSYNSKGTVIGTVNIENNNFLPARVKLDNFILCNENDNLDVIELYYSDSSRSEFFLGNSYFKYVDVSAKSSKRLDLIMMYYLRPDSKSFDEVEMTYNLYNIEEDVNLRSCTDLNPVNAIEKIEIVFKNEAENFNR